MPPTPYNLGLAELTQGRQALAVLFAQLLAVGRQLGVSADALLPYRLVDHDAAIGGRELARQGRLAGTVFAVWLRHNKALVERLAGRKFAATANGGGANPGG